MIKLNEFWREQDTLEKQIFWIVLAVCTAITFISSIITIIEKLNIVASIATCVCFLLFIVLMIIAYKFKKQKSCYIVMCYTLNCILLPIAFFSCGGIKSGMVCYFLASIFLCTPCLKGKTRTFAFAVALAALTGTMIVSVIYPELVVEISTFESNVDIIISFVLISICIYYISCQVVYAYEKQKFKTEQLLIELDVLSKKDVLTGMYNRRILFSHLEDYVEKNPENFHIAMFDIDNFKKINDTYGHLFGDRVLTEVSRVIRSNIDENCNEIASRYGGEEFVCLFSNTDTESAFSKTEAIRSGISALKFKEFPKIHITISGGLISCKDYDSISDMLKNADERLYNAKLSGKNKIVAVSTCNK